MRTLLPALLLGTALALAGATTCPACPQPMATLEYEAMTTPPFDVVLIASPADYDLAHTMVHEMRSHGLRVAFTNATDRTPEVFGLVDYAPDTLGLAGSRVELPVTMMRAAQRTLMHAPLPYMGYMKGYYGRRLLAGNFYWHVVPAHKVPVDLAPAQGFAGSIDRG